MAMSKMSLCGLALVFAAIALPAQDSEELIPVMRIEPPKCLPSRGHAPVSVHLDSDENVSEIRPHRSCLNGGKNV